MLSTNIWTSGEHERTDKDGHGEGNVLRFKFELTTGYLRDFWVTETVFSGVHSGQGGHGEESEETDGVWVCDDEPGGFDRQKREGFNEKHRQSNTNEKFK